jgi:hypothetical protein
VLDTITRMMAELALVTGSEIPARDYNTEIIQAVHERPAGMLPASRRLTARR